MKTKSVPTYVKKQISGFLEYRSTKLSFPSMPKESSLNGSGHNSPALRCSLIPEANLKKYEKIRLLNFQVTEHQ